MATNSNSSTSIFKIFCVLLGVAFIVLRLCHVIDWSWWIVIAPLFAPIIVNILFLVVSFICVLIYAKYKQNEIKKNHKKLVEQIHKPV